MIWVFPRRSTSVRKITKSFVKFLQNCVLILNGKENKEAGKICSEIMIPRKRNKELLWKVPSKIYGSNFIIEKTKYFLVRKYFQISSPRNQDYVLNFSS